jgi:tol-pal system protein YbgF
MGGVAAVVVATLPVLTLAQEYLPPVIDRSMGTGRPVVQGRGAAAAAPSFDERLVRIERLVDNQALVDMLMRLDTLQTDSQALRGEMETLSHEMEGLKQRQRELYLDIDTRLRKLEEAASKQPVAVAPSAAVPVAVAPTGSVAVAPQGRGDPAKERDAYQKAFNTLKDGQYEQAITEFQNFLSQYPSGDFTDNAQYWLGESNYATRRYNVAVQEFRKLLEQRPDSSKAADAMLKLGYAYYELGEWDSARKTLTDVVSRHANSTAARLAESRLQKMRLEGR